MSNSSRSVAAIAAVAIALTVSVFAQPPAESKPPASKADPVAKLAGEGSQDAKKGKQAEGTAAPQAKPAQPEQPEGTADAEPQSRHDAARAAIARAVQQYAEAFNQKDAEAVAKLWTADGVYIDRLTQDRVVGRTALKAELEQLFQQETARTLALVTESIDFISPSVAVERGVASVTIGDEPPVTSLYRTVMVRQNGAWLIDRVTEEPAAVESERTRQLRALAWLVGNWVDVQGETVIRVECQWTSNDTYLARRYTVTENQEVVSSGLQLIGWDAKRKELRSWLFDSEGGFVTATWEQQGPLWVTQAVATLADGSTGSFSSVFRPIDNDHFGWRKVNQVLDGELLPNLEETVVTRE